MTELITLVMKLFFEAMVSEIAKGAWIKFKETLLQKYPSVDLEKIEKDPTSKENQENLAKELKETGADKDEEIIELATSLIELVQTSNEKENKDSPKDKSGDDLLEYAELEAGKIALEKIFEKHFSNLAFIRGKYPIEDIELISVKIANSQSARDSNIVQEISLLHNKIRGVIQRVAIHVESRKTFTAEQVFNDSNLNYVNKDRARKIIFADNRIKISFQTLKATIEYFKEMNETILKWADDPVWQRKREMGLAIWNAILVYELTDYVINYIENFTVDGYKELLEMHDETKKTKDYISKEENSLAQESAELDNSDSLAKTVTAEEIKNRNKAMEIWEQVWKEYIESVESVESEFSVIKSKLRVLKVRRHSALNQILVLQALEMFKIIKQNISVFENTITTLESIKLMQLSPERIKRMLGIPEQRV